LRKRNIGSGTGARAERPSDRKFAYGCEFRAVCIVNKPYCAAGSGASYGFSSSTSYDSRIGDLSGAVGKPRSISSRPFIELRGSGEAPLLKIKEDLISKKAKDW